MDKDNDCEFDYEIMSEDYPTYNLSFKVIILEDSGVEKLLNCKYGILVERYIIL